MLNSTLIPRMMATAIGCASLTVALQEADGATVFFDQDFYSSSPGAVLSVTVSIRYSEGEQPDLFSYGVKLFGQEADTRFAFTSVSVVPALDFDGPRGPGAFRQIAQDFAGIKGTVDLAPSPVAAYAESRLATFDIIFDDEGVFTLAMDSFNTLGPTEEIFVAGDGSILDGNLQFGTTTVTVIPEPSSLLLLASGAFAALAMRRRWPIAIK